jgi:hypothetical protein
VLKTSARGNRFQAMLRRASFQLGVSRRISTRLVLASLLALVGAVGAASTALADARVTRAELDGTRLRIEGTAIANRVTAGGVTAYNIITVWTPFHYANGSVSILPGGNGCQPNLVLK